MSNRGKHDAVKRWVMPEHIFDSIISKFSNLSTLAKKDDHISRLTLMNTVQKSYWYFVDVLSKAPDSKTEVVGEESFFHALLQKLFIFCNLYRYISPSIYCSDWIQWTRFGMVGGAAFIRMNPNTSQWETMIVKCFKPHYKEYSSTWVGGKADPTDETLWQCCVREVFEEIGMDISQDRSKVVAVLQTKRVFNAVIPIAYDDERLQSLRKPDVEIHSIIWVPVSLNLDIVKNPTLIRNVTFGDGNFEKKEDPEDLRMPNDFKTSFGKLQDMMSSGTPKNDDESIKLLDIDPKDWFLKK